MPTPGQPNPYLGKRSMECYYCHQSYIPRESDRAGQSAKAGILAGLGVCLAGAAILPFFGKAWLILAIPAAALCVFLLLDVGKNIPIQCPKCGKHVLYRPQAPSWMKF